MSDFDVDLNDHGIDINKGGNISSILISRPLIIVDFGFIVDPRSKSGCPGTHFLNVDLQ